MSEEERDLSASDGLIPRDVTDAFLDPDARIAAATVLSVTQVYWIVQEYFAGMLHTLHTTDANMTYDQQLLEARHCVARLVATGACEGHRGLAAAVIALALDDAPREREARDWLATTGAYWIDLLGGRAA